MYRVPYRLLVQLQLQQKQPLHLRYYYYWTTGLNCMQEYYQTHLQCQKIYRLLQQQLQQTLPTTITTATTTSLQLSTNTT